MNINLQNSLRSLVLAGIPLIAPPAAGAVNLGPMAWIGDAGNADDDLTGFGGVAAAYQIAEYEVTNGQYAEFLSHVATTTDPYGLYNPNMGVDARGGIARTGVAGSYSYTVRDHMGDKPVNFVGFADAARFCNWIANGQGGGSTETGCYAMAGTYLTHAPTASVWIPTQNEWYKAAYYDGASASYSAYATQGDSPPTVANADATGNITNPGSSVANYNIGADWNGQDGNLTTVGSAGATSAYGTYDQSGNVTEWTEAKSGLCRVVRGGAFDQPFNDQASSMSQNVLAANETPDLGFRVAIPEPTTGLLAVLAAGMPLVRRKRR